MGFFDRGGSMIIFGAASVGGLAGAVVVGPRYFTAISKADRRRVQEGAD
jgi:ammonia channel protein AmtB